MLQPLLHLPPPLQGDSQAAMLEYRRAEKLLHNGKRNQAPLLAQAALHYSQGNLSAAMNM